MQAFLRRHVLSYGLVAMTLCLTPLTGAIAQTTVDIHDFNPSPTGASPYTGLVQGTDGSYYGTTTGGGGASGYGTIFKVTAAGVMTVLHSFSGTDGAFPQGRLVQASDGNFYGTTAYGGSTFSNTWEGDGTVFKITSAGVFTLLHSCGATTNDFFPYAGLIQGTDGSLYGTASQGGTSAEGSVFKITTAGVFTSLHSFVGTDGTYPYSSLLQGSNGNFYGTTTQGGASSNGVVFEMTPAGVVTTLHSFAYTDGGDPYAGLVKGTDGNYYGTTLSGPDNCGIVYKITPTGTYSIVNALIGSGTGASPYASLTLGSDGNFYGTTSYYTFMPGSIFKVTPAGVLTVLHTFTGTDGFGPSGSLVQGTDGNFYGTTIQGGSGGRGVIFKITSAGVFTNVLALAGSDASVSQANLIQGTDGNFYGTTKSGGASNAGSVVKVTPSGVVTVLHSFTGGSDGGYPTAGLVQASDGNFYGTTFGIYASTPPSNGTVFKITPAGVLTTLHSFTGGTDGGNSHSTLVIGSGGLLYGTSESGGNNGSGTVFSITTAGVLTTLYSFTGGSDGYYPTTLTLGTDGNFYSITDEGGVNGEGTVFKITPAGVLTTLHAFAGADGEFPVGALVVGSDGNYYGTTSAVTSGNGTIFKITSAGVLTTLHTFNGLDGNEPYGSLKLGADGNFYGTTEQGGSNASFADGTIFKMTPTGTLTSLYSFSGLNGSSPYAGLVQGTDGNFYGTTSAGGKYGGGNVFVVVYHLAAPTGLTATAGSLQVALSWSGVVGATSYSVYRSTTIGGEGTTPIATGISATTYTNTGLTAGTTYYYKVGAVNAGGSSSLSAEVSAIPKPAVPTGVTATAGDESITVAWLTSAGATSYNVYRSVSGGAYTLLTTTTAISYKSAGLTNGTVYSYEIAAVNSTGTSANSAAATATPVPVAIISGPTFNINGSSATVTWTTNVPAQSEVEYGSPGFGLSAGSTTLVTSHSVLLGNLVPGDTYSYDVISTDTITTATSSGLFFVP